MHTISHHHVIQLGLHHLLPLHPFAVFNANRQLHLKAHVAWQRISCQDASPGVETHAPQLILESHDAAKMILGVVNFCYLGALPKLQDLLRFVQHKQRHVGQAEPSQHLTPNDTNCCHHTHQISPIHQTASVPLNSRVESLCKLHCSASISLSVHRRSPVFLVALND